MDFCYLDVRYYSFTKWIYSLIFLPHLCNTNTLKIWYILLAVTKNSRGNQLVSGQYKMECLNHSTAEFTSLGLLKLFYTRYRRNIETTLPKEMNSHLMFQIYQIGSMTLMYDVMILQAIIIILTSKTKVKVN